MSSRWTWSKAWISQLFPQARNPTQSGSAAHVMRAAQQVVCLQLVHASLQYPDPKATPQSVWPILHAFDAVASAVQPCVRSMSGLPSTQRMGCVARHAMRACASAKQEVVVLEANADTQDP
jgi:hypothetical protein